MHNKYFFWIIDNKGWIRYHIQVKGEYMKKIVCLLIGFLLALSCSGATPNVPSTIPISIEGFDGTTGVAVDSSFIYEFDKPVETSTVTETSFFIVQTPEDSADACLPGARLQASLDVESESAILDPTDDLSAGTEHTICLTGDIAYLDGSAFAAVQLNFTTAGSNSNLSISSMGKTSNTSMTDGQGEVDLTFTFSGDASSLSPAVLVANSSGVSMTTSCAFQSGSTTIYECSVSGLATCVGLVDYSIGLTGTGINSYSSTLNSADYEGDTADAYSETAGGACWDAIINSDGSHPVTIVVQNDGSGLLMTATGGHVGGENVVVDFLKSVGGLNSFAYSVYYPSVEPIPIAANEESVVAAGVASGDEFNGVFLNSGAQDGGRAEFDGLALDATISGVDQTVVPKDSGDLSSLASQYYSPVYLCIVSNNYMMTTYISGDGETYIQTTTNNMQCATGDSGCSISEVVAYDGSSIADNFVIDLSNEPEGEVMTALLRYVRFNVTNIEGSASDCPAF